MSSTEIKNELVPSAFEALNLENVVSIMLLIVIYNPMDFPQSLLMNERVHLC